MTLHKLPAHVADAFAHQAAACRDLGSPLTATVCALVAEHGLPDSETRRRIATWPGLETSRGDVVPLRFTGALHRLVLDGAFLRLPGHAGRARRRPRRGRLLAHGVAHD